MKSLLATLFLAALNAAGSTITIVPVFEPLSLHGTDGDGAASEIGEALQASVMPRPMALTGAFPEDLVAAIRTPHRIPSNNPNYKAEETNLLVLCNVGIHAEIVDEILIVKLDVAKLAIPPEVDLTTRQVLKLAIIAIRKTLEEYQRPQTQPISVALSIEGADEGKTTLRDLGARFTIPELTPEN